MSQTNKPNEEKPKDDQPKVDKGKLAQSIKDKEKAINSNQTVKK